MSELHLNMELTEDTKHIVEYTLCFSFSTKIAENRNLKDCLFSAFSPLVNYFLTQPRPNITMRNILKHLSRVLNVNILGFNRKKEELLAFESFVVLVFMKSTYAENVLLSMEDFEAKYPQFCESSIYLEERKRLFEFCNCVRFVQCLIPPKNNKEHILDLVSRLTEGFSVRRVTGTGMTKETARRYEIIHVEGHLKREERPMRRVDPSTKPPKERKKRGRPLSLRL